jgi:serine/threonine protein kinase
MQQRGIMHRDLKLSNILITEIAEASGNILGDQKAGKLLVKIIDFGLAV